MLVLVVGDCFQERRKSEGGGQNMPVGCIPYYGKQVLVWWCTNHAEKEAERRAGRDDINNHRTRDKRRVFQSETEGGFKLRLK